MPTTTVDFEAIAQELAKSEDLASEDVKKRYDSYGDGEVWEIDGEEWLLFADADAAEDGAEAYIKQAFEDEGPEFFSAELRKQFITVSKTDIDIDLIAAEEADSQLEDRDDDEIIKQADMESARDDLDEDADDYDEQLEKLVEDARDKLSEKIEQETAEQLRDDPVSWYENIVGKLTAENMPAWMTIDVNALAEYVVENDGVGHTLGSYDGNEVDLKSGAVAIRLN